MKTEKKNSLIASSLFSALGLTSYIGLVSLLFWKGNTLFGNAPNYLGPVLFLLLFVISAIVSIFIVFYKPFLLWDKKKSKEAINLVVYTAGWLFIFFLIILGVIIII